jgi:hypothetical protein
MRIPERKTMKLILLCTVLLLSPLPAPGETAGPSDLQKAKETTAAFGAALKAELVTAMQSGDALSAIDVCHTKAPQIAAAVALDNGMEISRVSLKNRNRNNAANDWQIDVLKSFETRLQSGENAQSLTWNEIRDGEFRFMKAIPTGGLCLQCHGQAITPAVAEKIAELYPQDRATGYTEGEIRGAFVVTRQTAGTVTEN